MTLQLNASSYASFDFHNNNYLDINWRDPDISLYWLPYNGQKVGNVCYNQNDVCDSEFYVDSICAIKLGSFKETSSFTTDAKSVKNKVIPMETASAQQIACTSWMILNPYQGMSQQLMLTGSILAKSKLYNLGKVLIPRTYYYYW